MQSPMAEGGIARLGYANGQLVQPGPGRPGYGGPQDWGQEERADKVSAGTASPRERDLHYGNVPGGQGTYNPYTAAAQQETKDLNQRKAIETYEKEPMTFPGSTYVKAIRSVAGDTSFDRTRRNKQRLAYLNTLSPEIRKAFFNKLGISEEEDYDDMDAMAAAYGKALSSTDALDLLNFDKGYGEWLATEEGGSNPNLLMAGNVGGRNQIGGDNQALPNYYAPRDVHPGTGGTTDATGAQVSDWNVASLDLPFDRSTPEHDLSGIYAADGGRVPAAYGGIMGDDGRRAYGLGSIFKKAKRAIKKVAKSPIGKAALGYLAYTYGPGFLSGTGFDMGKAGLGGEGGWKKLLAGKFDPSKGGMNIWRGITGASALGGLYTAMNPEDEDEDEGYQKWLAEKNRWLGQIGDFPVNPVDPLYQRNLMAADGGRIGYDNGGLSSLDFVDKIYSDEARALAGNMPEIRKHGSQYAPTLFEERTDTGEWKYPGEPREGQEYLTSTLQGANTILDKMEMKKQRLRELAKEKGLDFDDIFKMELDRIYDREGPATKDLTKIKDRERILEDMEFKLKETNIYDKFFKKAQGGRIGYAGGGYYDEEEEEGHRSAALSAMYGDRMGAQEGGLMDLGGMEKDYRQEGGFVPLGGEERADDVPARLSKNEFVFTADAVRSAGGGDIDAGAEVMENVMNNLEQGGQISEESQGLEGARDMFATAQRLEGVL